MIVVCEKCQKKYNVDESKIPEQGIKVRCAQCGNIIFIKKEAAPKEERRDKEELRVRARRLARALAKDLLLYHGDKVEKGLKEGTLAQLLGGEIRKSWQYYCQQIPAEIRAEHDYFKEALNEIIGKGKVIFK
ncbi:hypothetical protein DRP53_05190 [candidate division WOR-3 bacterium]|uniref:Zinc finger/thioredoxin putative domain-containing protein n=1 Tax=candidate division WOR-3 bacterium TaxID=2052148 RepID=A0A660SHX7_UNCW3|nr:MAG: hypothetical protein DRP53_05190 [candidate division WOR-3 bacterium]